LEVSDQLHAPVALPTGEIALGTHWIGARVGPKVGLEEVERIKFLPYRDSDSDLSVVQHVDSRYTD
jgi:hypothetical protein